ncbi:MAG: 2,3,4,5-tetrahydropyridine-2-carboxylate N-succinyltransferase, partial [Alphaproteobacteria bacterium]
MGKMATQDLQTVIDEAWENRDNVSPDTEGAVRDAIEAALDALDTGALRVAQKIDGAWTVHQWAKKAVLLS